MRIVWYKLDVQPWPVRTNTGWETRDTTGRRNIHSGGVNHLDLGRRGITSIRSDVRRDQFTGRRDHQSCDTNRGTWENSPGRSSTLTTTTEVGDHHHHHWRRRRQRRQLWGQERRTNERWHPPELNHYADEPVSQVEVWRRRFLLRLRENQQCMGTTKTMWQTWVGIRVSRKD